jgi:DNA invertase Pin-like site-specific DNA recombinase
MIVGYARVSTQDQTLDAQLADLKAAGATKVYREKISGVRADRPELAKLMKTIGKGDTILVTKLDRLGRSLRELVNLLHHLNEAGIGFRSLGDPWCDTTSASGKLMLAIVGALAEYERSLIISRTSEGRERAKAAGVRFGRPRKLSPYQLAEATRRKQAGESWGSLAQSYGTSLSTVARLC